MRDLTRPLQECLRAMDDKHNLQEVLRRYPADRDELIGLLRLSVDLGAMEAPAADPAFRLRARNRMLAAAAHRRQARRWNPLAALPRPVVRLAYAGALAAALLVGGLTAAAASDNSLPGDPLYGIKLGVERARLATTFDSAARVRLELQFADDLGTTNINWATFTNATPTVVGDDNSLTFTNVSGNQFFRLRRGQ